ncbi:hypothetical protein VW23_007915 [Devosia insulae DS-56]|uniref:Lysozyme n=1 Tax=Devosia insulae DS-56 TaxID=1116389 RepID=A0A1E5XX66_9HYPH|nr:hypothetical protein VW23_007915 [Devosia insulae DS-56]
MRRVLAELYPERRAAMTLVEDAGLTAADIDFDGSSLTMWASILRHARPRDTIDAVLERALADNPDNQELLKAQRHEPSSPLPTGRAGGIALGGVAVALVVVVVLGYSIWTSMRISALEGKVTQQESELLETKVNLAKAPFAPARLPVLDEAKVPGNLPSVQETRQLLSQDAIDLMVAFEIGSAKGQDLPAHLFRGSINIGIGYDLGFVTAEQFTRDWGARLPAEMLVRLSPWVGRRDVPDGYNLEGITIPWQDALDVFLGSSVRPFVAGVLALPRADELPADSFGALVSLAYNMGMGGLTSQGARIRDLLASGEFAAIPAQIIAMKRLGPKFPGLQRRRDAEALLFQLGLDKQQLQGTL